MLRRSLLIAVAVILGLVAGPAHAGLILTLDDKPFEGPSGTIFSV